MAACWLQQTSCDGQAGAASLPALSLASRTGILVSASRLLCSTSILERTKI